MPAIATVGTAAGNLCNYYWRKQQWIQQLHAQERGYVNELTSLRERLQARDVDIIRLDREWNQCRQEIKQSLEHCAALREERAN